MKVQDTESSVVAERESRFALPTEIVDLMQRQPLNNLGGIFYKKKDFKSAEMCFGRAIMLRPDMQQAKINLELTKKAMVKP